MNFDFLCPKCHGHLRVGDHIIFSVKTENKESGLILMHPEFGNYKYENHSSLRLEEGKHIDFYCPICHAKLTSDRHENLVKIIMCDENGKEFEILFSKIAGQKCTYKIIGESVEVFGKDSDDYIDFFNLSAMT